MKRVLRLAGDEERGSALREQRDVLLWNARLARSRLEVAPLDPNVGEGGILAHAHEIVVVVEAQPRGHRLRCSRRAAPGRIVPEQDEPTPVDQNTPDLRKRRDGIDLGMIYKEIPVE